MAPCYLVCGYKRFGGAHSIAFYFTFKAVMLPQKLVSNYQTTPIYNTKGNINLHSRGNVKPHISVTDHIVNPKVLKHFR